MAYPSEPTKPKTKMNPAQLARWKEFRDAAVARQLSTTEGDPRNNPGRQGSSDPSASLGDPRGSTRRGRQRGAGGTPGTPTSGSTGSSASLGTTSGGTSGNLPWGGASTGVGADYMNQAAFQSTIYDLPQQLLIGAGYDPSSAGYGTLANLPFDPYNMYVMSGATMPATNGGDAFATWAQGMYEGIGNQGEWFNAPELFGNIFNGDPNSTLYRDLNAPGLDPMAQIGMIGGYLRDAAAATLDPIAARAMMNTYNGLAPAFAQQLGSNPASSAQGALDWFGPKLGF